jgi:hypothetical protein
MPVGAVFTGPIAPLVFGTPDLNNAGQTAFRGNVTGGGVDSTNNEGIWLATSGSLALAVRSGDHAPGTPDGVNFAAVSTADSPRLNDAGQLAFSAYLTGPGVSSSNLMGLWSGAPGSLALVARTGEHAPGTQGGVVFFGFYGDLYYKQRSPMILNAAGQTAFSAFLEGSGISPSNDRGIWATDHSGVLQLIAREGDPLEVAPGDFRTVSSLVFLTDAISTYSTGNSDGRPSAFNNLGQLAFRASFTDGSSGIFVSNRVAVPEPSTFVLAAAALGLCFARRKKPSACLPQNVGSPLGKWRNRIVLSFLVLSTTSIGTPGLAAPLYKITQVGPGGGCCADGLTEAGQVFGASVPSGGGRSAWVYTGTTTIELGLTGPEFTRSDGYKYSVVGSLNQAEHALGASYRYVGQYNNGPGAIPWLYNGENTIRLGFTGPEYTWSNGFQNGGATGFNAAGQVSGYSWRYNGGVSAWFYNGATTVEIGLTGSEYTRNDGYKVVQADGLNEFGQVVGRSNRYSGSADLGQSAWLYDGATTIDIGLTGAEYTRNDGFKSSIAYGLNDSGQVSGYSSRYSGSVFLGSSVWFYNGATTRDIGLTGPEHTRSDGYKSSSLSFGGQDESGKVVGTSRRFNGGSVDRGVSAWLYNGATTSNVGLTGTEFTRNDGYQRSFLSARNAVGQVLGYSDRYNGGSAQLGQSVWLYNGEATIELGLVGPGYTRSDGYRYSNADVNILNNGLNEAGQVLGYSVRYNGATAIGSTPWFYNGTTTIELGLSGPEFTGSDGSSYSGPQSWNKAGQVLGFSTRYNGGSDPLGGSCWLFDGATTIELGLAGPEYTRSDGYRLSSARTLNEASQVIGSSPRYSGDADLGQDAWFYDPILQQTSPLRLSTRSDGYARSEAYFLGEDGLVLGAYTLFDELGNDLGSRNFYFTPSDGLHDLGSLVEGGLAVNGWTSLTNGAYEANSRGQILGTGKLSPDGKFASYLLTPISVPEPSTFILAAAALGLCLALYRRESIDRPLSH